jgi:hypothetical protein
MGRRGWEPAKATVKARRESSKFAMGQDTDVSVAKRYEYVVDVSPSGGDAPFTTTMVTPMFVERWRPLREGDVVTVLHKPGTEEVKWDRSEPSTNRKVAWKAAQQEMKRAADERFEAARRAEPGRAPGEADARPRAAMHDPELAELLEAEERARDDG